MRARDGGETCAARLDEFAGDIGSDGRPHFASEHFRFGVHADATDRTAAIAHKITALRTMPVSSEPVRK